MTTVFLEATKRGTLLNLAHVVDFYESNGTVLAETVDEGTVKLDDDSLYQLYDRLVDSGVVIVRSRM